MFKKLKSKIRLKKIKKLLQDIKQDNKEYREIINDTKSLVKDCMDSTVHVLYELQTANQSLKEVLHKNE